MTEEEIKIIEIFSPGMPGKIEQFNDPSGMFKFVHYTSADAAQKIIENKAVWLRLASQMDDYSEMQHGYELLMSAYKNPKNNARLSTISGEIGSQVFKSFVSEFERIVDFIKKDTFITCLSQHDVKNEDQHGRLSMWRAYGGNSGVAIVLNSKPFGSLTTSAGYWSGEVLYLSEDEFASAYEALLSRMEKNIDLLKRKPPELFKDWLKVVFRKAIICTKHPGFKEEKEWRVFHTAGVDEKGVTEEKVETISGVPEIIVKVPLKDQPELGIIGLEPKCFIDKIIIGPTDRPNGMRKMFSRILDKQGFESAESRVVVSAIPLRR